MKTIIKSDNLSSLFVCLLLGVDLVPPIGCIDNMGSQWLYLALIDFLAVVFILFKRDEFGEVFGMIFGNKIVRGLLVFFVLAGISVFFGINKVEGMVVYSRLAIAVVSFFVLSLLMRRNLVYFCKVISYMALLQCSIILFNFFMDYGSKPLDGLILALQGFNGNKNVMAACLIMKLPFIGFLISESKYKHCFSFFIVVFMIFLLNARAAYISLIIQVLFYLIVFFKQRQVLIPVLVCFMLAFMLSQAFFFRFSDGGGYGTAVSRVQTISNVQDERLYLWGNAWKSIKSHPFTGVGLGNWKLASLPYEADHYDYFQYSKHVHNDFLEYTAEGVFILGLAFLDLFAIALICGLKYKYKPFYFALLAISGYFIDALFNFPAERPVMQLYFMFGLAILSSQTFGEYKGNFKRWVIVGLTVVSGSLYISFSAFKSMRVQKQTFYDFGHRSDLNNMDFPAIPNLGEDNIPVDVVKAWYLSKERNYKGALILLKRSENVNPYNMANEWVKACVYDVLGQKDSVEYYMIKGRLTRPRNALFR